MKPRKQRCTAHSVRTGEPCQRWAMAGQTVCPSHGGRAPQNLNAARRRLEEAVPSLINELLRISESGKSERDRISAIKDALDRAGVGDRQEQRQTIELVVRWPD